MKESYGEGLANHTSLESCGNCSNVMAEALTEGSAGGLLSSEITSSRVPTTWSGWEGNTSCSVKSELQNGPAESWNLACVDIFYTGIGRSVSVSLKIRSKKERSVKEKFCTTGMNDSRKSDNNIVPEKPVNNEVKTFAEQVEGRALTEGNTMNTAAVRTQGRVTA